MNADDAQPTPPAWFDVILWLVLKPEDAHAVSGDLVEEYRETVYPSLGGFRADAWYAGQVIGLLLRGVRWRARRVERFDVAAARTRTTAARTLVTPPACLDAILRLVLKPEDAQTVSGDLVEEYRETVHPALGLGRADAWYARQVFGFVWRSTWTWSVLFGVLMTGRIALDWFVPPGSFYHRSLFTTWSAIAVFGALGFWTGWRTRSIAASAFAAVIVGAVAKILGMAVIAALLAVRHDPATLTAIARSGGVDEIFGVSIVALIVAPLLASVTGVVGKATASILTAVRQ